MRQKRSRKPSFNAVKAANANRNRNAVPRFRAGRRSWPSVFLLPGSSLGDVQVPGANCLLLCSSRFAGWLLCSFLPREESAYSPHPISHPWSWLTALESAFLQVSAISFQRGAQLLHAVGLLPAEFAAAKVPVSRGGAVNGAAQVQPLNDGGGPHIKHLAH